MVTMRHSEVGAQDALIVVDVQRDFLPGGALGVPDGHQIIRRITSLEFPYVALTRDWHPADHISFAIEPKFVDGSWPVHCVQGTPGAEIDSEIIEAFPSAPIFSKGQAQRWEAYSGFEGFSDGVGPLENWIYDNHIQTVTVVGLALDYCVKATALDAIPHVEQVYVLVDCTRPVAYETGALAVYEMTDSGVIFS